VAVPKQFLGRVFGIMALLTERKVPAQSAFSNLGSEIEYYLALPETSYGLHRILVLDKFFVEKILNSLFESNHELH
jgi:hypothetical protein